MMFLVQQLHQFLANLSIQRGNGDYKVNNFILFSVGNFHKFVENEILSKLVKYA